VDISDNNSEIEVITKPNDGGNHMGMTIAEKILARNAGLSTVKPGDMVMARVDRTRIVDYKVAEYYDLFDEIGIKKVWDPERIVMVIEHHVPPATQFHADAHVKCRKFAKKYGIKLAEVGRHGICHTYFVENGYARPGELVAAGDSHSCTYGAFNVASRGLGIDEMSYVLAKGMTWFKVPETVRFVLEGRLPSMSSAKDIILYIAGRYGTDVALYKSAEFVGEAAQALPLSGRITIANMGIEIGAKFAIFEADQKTIDYVRARTDEPFEPVKSDEDAHFSAIYNIDVSKIGPQVACPFSVSNVKAVEEVQGLPIHQCFIGSCTNGSLDDLRVAARILKNNDVHPDTRLIVIPASMQIYKQALKEGLIEIFVDAGAMVEGPTCGLCGGDRGVLGNGERGLYSNNRNFKGRQGKGAEVYLASPATVAASAIKGCITDPRIYA
jgi:3-isopropylmalate/(R)-2-methylmalate dehydratase large subunit